MIFDLVFSSALRVIGNQMFFGGKRKFGEVARSSFTGAGYQQQNYD